MYRISETERQSMAVRLGEVLRLIPLQDVAATIALAQRQIKEEPMRVVHLLGGKDKDAYFYVLYWISGVEKLLEADNIQAISVEFLHEHNHGHSGWVDIVERVYYSPRSEKERVLSKRIWELHVEIARAIFSKTTASSGKLLSIARHCIDRLGVDIPADLAVSLTAAMETK